MEKENFVQIKHNYNNRSAAEQDLTKQRLSGKIKNYRISWDTQFRMTVEIVKS